MATTVVNQLQANRLPASLLQIDCQQPLLACNKLRIGIGAQDWSVPSKLGFRKTA